MKTDDKVIISTSYHLPHMAGKTGKVLRVMDAKVDADRFDQDGNQIGFSQPFQYTIVKLDDYHGEWCFYLDSDLETL